MTIRNLLGPGAALILLIGGSACTLAKPLVGAIAAPVIVLGNTSDFGCGCNGDARGLVAAIGVIAAAGAVCGLVTGIVSDVQALSGNCEDPCANWWDPFATN